MAISAKALKSVLDLFDGAVGTGPGMNLSAFARSMVDAGGVQREQVPRLLARAATKGEFARGKLDDIEKEALNRILDTLGYDTAKAKNSLSMRYNPAKGTPKEEVPVMGTPEFDADPIFSMISNAAAKRPLFLTPANYPIRLTEQGFVPLTGVNVNNPAVGIKQINNPKFMERFIDEGATNIQAARNLNLDDARRYDDFYFRTRDQLAETGIPLDRIGGAWATLSAQASPVKNARLLKGVLRDPNATDTAKTIDDRMKALTYLAGQGDADTLGRAKRYNFMMNSTNPESPDFFTGDTRYMQNIMGLPQAYGLSVFRDAFNTKDPRVYNAIIQPGLEAARREGMLPNQIQGGSWGNWRKFMFGIDEDLPDNLLADIANFEYDPAVYAAALKRMQQ